MILNVSGAIQEDTENLDQMDYDLFFFLFKALQDIFFSTVNK